MDLQTSEREQVSARKRTEVEKFKAQLGERKSSAKVKEKEKVMQLGMIVDQMGQSLETEDENEPGSES